MLSICMYIPGEDPESRLLRKTLCRNCNLMAVLLFRTISQSVRKQLPTLQEVVNAGFMTSAEMERFQSVDATINMFWMPGMWCVHRLREAKLQGKITDPHGANIIMNVIVLAYKRTLFPI